MSSLINVAAIVAKMSTERSAGSGMAELLSSAESDNLCERHQSVLIDVAWGPETVGEGCRITARVDGSANLSDGLIGYAAVMQCSCGKHSAEVAAVVPGTNATEAEVLACLLGLGWAVQRQVRHLDLFTDHRGIARELNAARFIRKPRLKALLDVARGLKREVPECTVRHCMRREVSRAHKLAREALGQAIVARTVSPTISVSPSPVRDQVQVVEIIPQRLLEIVHRHAA